MFKQGAVPADFRPDYIKDFVFFGIHFVVKVQCIGPLPEVGKVNEPEVFWFAFYHLDELIDSGTLDWDTENGALTYDEVATAVLLFCNESN